ncbi:MAG: efflux RND transporter periplasmic adaptor subunit [Betaproteobacteria bacterium]|nr:MAG: efflux RND transporter periplasmic adaptor subunit [Betaproteobacteria bacterium]TAG46385.1 MAG: efflux RND transporter periplasmic adaptor subunit [Betaproteobacteria bacterium]
MNSMNRKVLTISILAAIAVAGIAVNTVVAADDNKSAATKDAAKSGATTAAKPSLTVTTAQAAVASWPIRLAANGNIAPWQEALIGAEANGLRLNDVRVNVGDVVRRGQVLATFAADTAQADVAQVNASIAESEAALAEATANAARAKSLQETGAMSAQQIAQYLTAEKTAQARLAAVKAQLQSSQLRLNFTRVVAPDDGVISARAATVGAVVGSGQELFRLIRKSRLEWRAEVTANELGKVLPGQAVIVTTPGGTNVNGKVRIVAPTVDTQTRNALVYVDLEKSAAAKAGMYAKGEFSVASSNALSVPQGAVVARDGFAYLMRLEAANKVAQIKVQTGRRVGDRVEILDGIKSGETVVATGAAFLTDGDTVRVVAAPAAAKVAPANAVTNSATNSATNAAPKQ